MNPPKLFRLEDKEAERIANSILADIYSRLIVVTPAQQAEWNATTAASSDKLNYLATLLGLI